MCLKAGAWPMSGFLQGSAARLRIRSAPLPSTRVGRWARAVSVSLRQVTGTRGGRENRSGEVSACWFDASREVVGLLWSLAGAAPIRYRNPTHPRCGAAVRAHGMAVAGFWRFSPHGHQGATRSPGPPPAKGAAAATAALLPSPQLLDQRNCFGAKPFRKPGRKESRKGSAAGRLLLASLLPGFLAERFRAGGNASREGNSAPSGISVSSEDVVVVGQRLVVRVGCLAQSLKPSSR